MRLSPYPLQLAPGSGTSAHAVDVVFAVCGSRLPSGYAQALWEALLGRLPWLADEPQVGVHAIRGSACDGGLLLSRRARLALRLPVHRLDDALALGGQVLEVGGERLELGDVRPRPLEPFPTLSAHFVATGLADTLAHQQTIEAMLGELQLPLRFICGRMQTVNLGARVVAGAELVLHELRPEQSLALQERGLGADRHLGHGLFLPHKTISGID